MKHFWQKTWKYILMAMILTVIFMSPYLFRDFLGIEHDTFFHLSRIQGLAEAISRGDYFPAIYPYKNNGFGYASPLFYSDVLLIPSALLYSAGMSLAGSYKFTVFWMTFLSIFNMEMLLNYVLKKKGVIYIGAIAFTFANYRITDVYVRGALGEVAALAFLPVVILGLYEILEKGKSEFWWIYCLGLSLMAISHNISFLFSVIISIIFFFINFNKVNQKIFLALCKGVGLAFCMTAFFTLPMLEQTFSQDFVLKYWGSDMGSQSMTLSQYLANKTIFGYGGHTSEKQMLENAGLFLEFVPLLYFLVPKNQRANQPFIKHCLILGYVFMILPSELIPWQYLSFLGIIQFPWRLSMIAMTFLTIPASFAIGELFTKQIGYIILSLAMISEGIWHLQPCFDRTFGITSQTAYEDIISGELCDPYYSADYVRVELAGGDYLNINHPDFRVYSTSIKDQNGGDTDIAYTKNGTAVTFTTTEENLTLIMPLSYYKGYRAYRIENGGLKEVDCWMSHEAMVELKAEKVGTYMVVYQNTPLRTGSFTLSAFALGFMIYLYTQKEVRHIQP